jgi:DNA-binding NarL/FixJ family response regulator
MPGIGWGVPLPDGGAGRTVRGMVEVSVLVVDDQPVFRRAMASLIEATPGFAQVGEAASGREALQLADALRPDLVLLDVRMPDMDGIETSRRLVDAHRGMAVVLISIADLPSLDAADESASGAAACVRKQDLSTRTLPELWSAISGRGRVPSGPSRERPFRGRASS